MFINKILKALRHAERWLVETATDWYEVILVFNFLFFIFRICSLALKLLSRIGSWRARHRHFYECKRCLAKVYADRVLKICGNCKAKYPVPVAP